LIYEISSETEISALELFIIISTGSKKITEIRETYVYPNLIPHIASWASPQFGAKVSKIVNKYFIEKIIEEKDRLIKKER